MNASRLNHAAVLVSALAFWLLGALWYMPLFGRQWLALSGHTPGGDMSGMAPAMIGTLICDVVAAYVIAIALSKSDAENMARHGAEFGVFMGLGIFGTMYLMNFLYEGRPIALWAINTGYVVVGLAMMGAIIGAWRAKAITTA